MASLSYSRHELASSKDLLMQSCNMYGEHFGSHNDSPPLQYCPQLSTTSLDFCASYDLLQNFDIPLWVAMEGHDGKLDMDLNANDSIKSSEMADIVLHSSCISSSSALSNVDDYKDHRNYTKAPSRLALSERAHDENPHYRLNPLAQELNCIDVGIADPMNAPAAWPAMNAPMEFNDHDQEAQTIINATSPAALLSSSSPALYYGYRNVVPSSAAGHDHNYMLQSVYSTAMNSLCRSDDLGTSSLASEMVAHVDDHQIHHNIVVKREERECAGDEPPLISTTNSPNIAARPLYDCQCSIDEKTTHNCRTRKRAAGRAQCRQAKKLAVGQGRHYPAGIDENDEDGAADVVHVRARRGQATDSHSLAERVRREKISQRMKLLQELVPGCTKALGKAAVLEEIINYVKSLQYQIEFLSMRLANTAHQQGNFHF
ncbi:hypothetical protein GOP47_0026696 [Adiantum capillus-veneris]|nr:hypothetical protein GOP47_0026696 [Adiantum capillus-veneris]